MTSSPKGCRLKPPNEVLRRLGSPEDLGDRFRRTHQTTQRLLAAVGGGIWQGAQDGIRGYLAGAILGMAVVIVLLMVGQAMSADGRLAGTFLAKAAFSSFTSGVLCVAAGWGARGLVRGFASGARRRGGRPRPDRLVGGSLLALLVASMRAEHVWLSVLLSIAVPVIFIVSALRTTEHQILGHRSTGSRGHRDGHVFGGSCSSRSSGS